MEKKVRIGVVFGGQSPEHEVSIESARSILQHLDPEKYTVTPIGIDKKGSWHFFQRERALLSLERKFLPTFKKNDPYFPLISSPLKKGELFFSPCVLRRNFDLFFPIIHGQCGEDGTIQGLFRLANLPFVGSDVLGSSLCMDKTVMKAVLRDAKFPLTRYLCISRYEKFNVEKIIKEFPFPLFVKPANLGSSVGINKAHHEAELLPFIEEAFQYDEKILIEECISGKEIECSVLGNLNPIASLPGEIIPQHEFYSYEAKYLDEKGARFQLPAILSEKKTKEIQNLAIRAFKVLCCEGMARVDFFMQKGEKVILNEINTIPGFTTISLYPKLWEISGLSYSALLDRLIQLAIERYKRKSKLKISYDS
jgi:D-alanine-D-alanine ligase